MPDKDQVSAKQEKPKLKAQKPWPVVLGVIAGFAIAFFALSGAGFFDESFGDTFGSTFSTSDTLTPARSLEGTWKTAFSTQFMIATDFQYGYLVNVGSENRTMTWVITRTGNENIVSVDVYFSTSNRQLITGSGYTPDVSPMTLTGYINGTQLILAKSSSGFVEQVGSVAVMTFTTHQMEGTWHDYWIGAYEQYVYTSTNALKLVKQ